MTPAKLPQSIRVIADTATRDHPDAVVTVIDTDEVFRYVSPSVQSIIGYHPLDQVGCHFAEFYSSLDAAHFRLAFTEAMLFGESSRITRNVRCKTGGYQCMHGKSKYVIDSDTGGAYFLQIGYPVADRPNM